MVLIEREAVLALLQTQFNNVADGEGHCLFVSGEAGIGKTSLIKAFCKLQRGACNIYQGACDALFTPRPLAPLYDIILQVNSGLWPNTYALEERSELFSKFFHELSSLRERILIVFEDIHWADEATLDFIKFFARRITQLPCLFILTFRDDEILPSHPLRNVLGYLSPDTFTRIQLNPLSREAVYRMAEEKGYDAENVYNISGGNPFYVSEILASYSTGVPDNIKDAILSVYDRQLEGTKAAWQLCSVIPEGLEIERFAKIKASWYEAMDHCFAMNIITIKNEKVVFKHELYRRTIEASLSPFKRIEVNRKILDLLLTSFEERGEIERIVHYAKNANEKKLVTKYAPMAARQAASLGAHTEASKLFLTAIESFEGNDLDELVEFYECYAYECYLTNQIKEAIIYQARALNIWQDKGATEKTGSSMRFLSRLWWFEGNRELAERYGKDAIDILQNYPASKAKAMAFSNMSQLKMLSEETAECIEWGTRAINLAKEIKDDEILCHALNNVGTAQWQTDPFSETANKLLMESLDIALINSYQEHAARAYSNIFSYSIEFKNYVLAKQFSQEAIGYCEEKGLYSWTKYLLSWKVRMLMETGNWPEAAAIAQSLLSNAEQPVIVKIGALVTLAKIKLRAGEPDAFVHLQQAKSLAFITKEHHQIMPVIIALLEYEWLTSRTVIADEELNICIDLIQKVDNIFLNSEFAFWTQKARRQELRLVKTYEPYQLLKDGKVMQAAELWHNTGCPFEKALAQAEGNEDDKRGALLALQQLGAAAVCEKIKMAMRAVGIKKIPRGSRESTKTNPAQLTNRELDVIHLLQKAVQNKEIAETLFISPKTVDHHISSILFKLDVNSRSKAVNKAVRLGILKEYVAGGD